MERKQKKIKGITLIALVVTIVVLLILAGASIAMLIGDNGIIVQAKRARQENKKGEIKEELELEIADMRATKATKGEILTQQEVIDRITEKGVIIITTTEGLIQGEYKDYEIMLDDKYNITIGGELTGAKPTLEVKILDTAQGIQSVRIQIIASTTDGEIASIEPLNGAKLKTKNSEGDQIFEVTKNGKYNFKITGTNKRAIIVECEEITNIVPLTGGLLEEIGKIENGGVQNVKVVVKQSGKVEQKNYASNVIIHKGDLVLDGTSEAAGVKPSNKVYSFGSQSDVATASANAKNTVVLKVEGNLTINSGVTLTAVRSTEGYGGPKGMVIYCTGKLTNNGTITMIARGAKAVGENVYLWMNKNGTYETVPATGGARWKRNRC